MKNLSTYLVIMFMIMYWVFRVVVAVTDTIGINIGFSITNYGVEVAFLFITLLSIILILKRKVLGAILYLVTYGWYFGGPLLNQIIAITSPDTAFDINLYTDLMANAIGVVLPIFALFDLLLDKNRMAHPVDKKTDWFYKNEQYDRKMDDRADKNNYKTL